MNEDKIKEAVLKEYVYIKGGKIEGVIDLTLKKYKKLVGEKIDELMPDFIGGIELKKELEIDE